MFNLVYTNHPAHYEMGGVSAGMRSEYIMFDVPQTEVDEVVVVFSQQLADQLTTDQIATVLLHEEGHIALGHIALATEGNTTIINGCSMIIQANLEIEADTYAAERTSPQAVIAMLEQVRSIFIRKALETFDTVPNQRRDAFHKAFIASIDLQINPRIESLRSLI